MQAAVPGRIKAIFTPQSGGEPVELQLLSGTPEEISVVKEVLGDGELEIESELELTL